MGIVAQGAEGLSGHRRGQREAQRREQGLQAPEGPRAREKRDTCPTCQRPPPPVDTPVPLRALRSPVWSLVRQPGQPPRAS